MVPTFQLENPELRFLELRPGAIDTFFAGSIQGADGKDGFLNVQTVSDALKAVVHMPPDTRIEELVLRSIHQAIEY